MKHFCWVALVLILIGLCVGTQAEEISLTAENYTLTFDPGYPASLAQYATGYDVVDRVGFTRSIVDFGTDRIFAVIDIYEKPRFPASILNSFAIMARFDTFLGMLGANEHNMFLYNPENISGYPGVAAQFRYYEEPFSENHNFHTYYEIEIRLSRTARVHVVTGNWEAYNTTINSMKISPPL